MIVKLCNGSSVVAAADLPLQCLVTTGGQEMSVYRSVELVSGHNLSFGEDSEGNKPTLRINLSLVKTSYDIFDIRNIMIIFFNSELEIVKDNKERTDRHVWSGNN